jgi:hypothetical protein
MRIIATTGIARAGKDTFCAIAKDILAYNSIRVNQYSFANALKQELSPFLRDMCGVDVFTNDTELKKDIRDLLVWYGTTWWRKRDPQRWIRNVQLAIGDDDSRGLDVALVSDARYPNEGEWAHSLNGCTDLSGYLVHVAAWQMKPVMRDAPNGGVELVEVKTFYEAPNEQERINDPLMKATSDYQLEWEMMGLPPQEAVSNKELRLEVFKALKATGWFDNLRFPDL